MRSIEERTANIIAGATMQYMLDRLEEYDVTICDDFDFYHTLFTFEDTVQRIIKENYLNIK